MEISVMKIHLKHVIGKMVCVRLAIVMSDFWVNLSFEVIIFSQSIETIHKAV